MKKPIETAVYRNRETTKDDSFLPDFCNVRMVFAVVIIGELLAIVLSLAPFDRDRNRWEDLSVISLFIQWVALVSTGVLCLARGWLSRLNDRQAATLSYVLLLITTTTISEITYWTTKWMTVDSQHSVVWHADFLLSNLVISAIVSAIVLRYFYLQHEWGRHLQANAEARIQALHSRIRPHFLFNSLNTIASLTRSQPNQAEEATLDLADLFRDTLADSSYEAKLSEEITITKRYLRIEKLRLGKRLQVDWALHTVPMNALIPHLTIQPMIENAIYHGVEHIQGGGTILIKGDYENDMITIKVSNPIPLTKHKQLRESNQMAQENIKMRLAVLYGDKGGLNVQQNDNHYEICIHFPYIQERQ